MKVIRRILKFTGILLVLVIVAAVAFVATFDANNYKPQIIEQVESATGRDFRIDGDIRLSVFPWVGIKIEDVALGNAKGFEDKNFAAIRQLDVQVNVLPLLEKRVEVNTIRLNGLELSLEVAKNGDNNWSSLSQPAPSETGAEQKAEPPTSPPSTEPSATQDAAATSDELLQSLKVEGFEFVDAVIHYHDRTSGTEATISELNLQTSAISFDEPIKLSFSARVKNNQPQIDSRLELTTVLTFDQAFSQISLDDLLLTVVADARGLLPQPEKFELRTNVKVLMDEQLVSVRPLTLDALGLTMKASIGISQFQSTPVISGNVEVPEFNARQVAKRAGVELPAMAAAEALGRLSMKTRIKLAGERFEANDFAFHLDDSTLTGWIHLLNISKQQLRYELAFDRLNVNHYMPPVDETVSGQTPSQPDVTPTGSRPSAAAADTGDEKIELPMELMRSLDIQGDFRIADLTALEYRIKQFLMTVKAKDGLISLKPVSMQLLGGQVSSALSIDARKAVPAYSIKLDANQIQVGPVVDPFLVGVMGGKDMNMEGAMNMSMAINTRGETVNQLKRASKGKIAIRMKQSRLNGFDPAYYVRKSVADYVAGSGLGQYDAIMGEYKPRKVTVFDLVRSDIRLADGKARTDNFLMDSLRVKITAKGYVDIMENRLDMMTSLQLPRGKTVLEKVFDEPVYVRVYGPFEAVEYKVDTDRLKKSTTDVLKKEAKAKLDAEKKRLEEKARARAREEEARLREKAEAEKRRLKEKADAERKRAEEKAKNKLREKFKSLF